MSHSFASRRNNRRIARQAKKAGRTVLQLNKPEKKKKFIDRITSPLDPNRDQNVDPSIKAVPKQLLDASGKAAIIAPGIKGTSIVGKGAVKIAKVAAKNKDIVAGIGNRLGGSITRTATQGFGRSAITLVNQRAFVGRGGKTVIDKLFKALPKTASTAARFGSNTKTAGLTMSFASKLGLSLGAAGLLVGAIGSYPFAGFIKEESIQNLGFAFNTAEGNNDIEGMENAVQEVEEILTAAPTIIDKIPYANVQKQLQVFFKAAAVKLDNDKRRLETLRGEQEAGETAFQAERRESDEAAFERKRAFSEEEEARFEGIRQEGEERDRQENAAFDERRREGEIRQQEERELEDQFFEAIKNKDFALKDEILKKLRELAERR